MRNPCPGVEAWAGRLWEKPLAGRLPFPRTCRCCSLLECFLSGCEMCLDSACLGLLACAQKRFVAERKQIILEG